MTAGTQQHHRSSRGTQRTTCVVGTLSALFMMMSFAGGCATQQVRAFPLEPVQWHDDDQRPFREKPDTYWSGLAWDGLDQTLFVPLNRFLRMDFAGPAANVNAFDEVPNSSWFTNRIGLFELSDTELRNGACPEARLDPQRAWTIVAGKPNGANPGFIVEDDAGRGWVIKFDGRNFRDERATAADVFGSRVYHAAGYHAPCNIIVHFERDTLVIGDEATTESERGEIIPMQNHHVDEIVSSAIVDNNGLLRASASLYVEGEPLGPWRYQGTRHDDPNDVIPHEDRRELRGGRLLAAWINHFDAREQNTLATWVPTDSGGYIRHYYIDFGDSLGSRWQQDGLSRRFGYSSYFDPAHVAADFLSLGLISRPWHDVEVNEVAPLLGYFDAAHFEPERWRPGYPNPAFAREEPEDGAWMARIIARFDEHAVRVMLDEGDIIEQTHEEETVRTLMARRQRILDHYLRIRSPLADFEVQGDGTTICFRDLAATEGVTTPSTLLYETRYYDGDFRQPRWRRLENAEGAIDPQRICISLTHDGHRSYDRRSSVAPEGYAIVDLLVTEEPGADPIPPARLHFYDTEEGYRLVGIERPAVARPPLHR